MEIISTLDSSFAAGKTKKVSLTVYETYAYAFIERNTSDCSGNLDYDRIFIEATTRYLANRLAVEGYLFLNDALQCFGLRRVPSGQIAGWNNGLGPLEIGAELHDIADKPGEKVLWVTFKPHGVIVTDV